MEYGLIGKKLSHSLSPLIHSFLPTKNYDLVELNEEELDDFFLKKGFKGINVTIPYKEKVIKYLDEVDDIVKKTSSCNLIMNKNNKLIGYNTDYYGFDYLIKENRINVKNKNCYILGTGGTSKTIKAYLEDNKAKKVIRVSRTSLEDAISYEELEELDDVEILINATPRGMDPDIFTKSIDITNFKSLECVIDVIYNPLKTDLLLQAEKLNIPSINGLKMLIYQAYKASNILTNFNNEEILKDIYKKLMEESLNIVLIGLPMSGKSTIGKIVSEELNKPFYDVDKLIEEKEHKSIQEIFLLHGEKYFRIKESVMIKELSLLKGVVISTGGGVVLNKENISSLKKNGLIILLNRDIKKMRFSKKRPLLKNRNDYIKLKNQRQIYYEEAKDVTIEDDELLERVKKVIGVYYESFNY